MEGYCCENILSLMILNYEDLSGGCRHGVSRNLTGCSGKIGNLLHFTFYFLVFTPLATTA